MAGTAKKGQDIHPTRLIACGVFRPVLDSLRITVRYPDLRLTFLPSNLHLFPRDLEEKLHRELVAAKKGEERTICLYGECFPDIEGFCRHRGVIKVPGHHCYEMLLGRDIFRRIMGEEAGTYFLERDLILHFEEYCARPLELNDEEMRKFCFRHYKRLIYIRQPSDPDLLAKARNLEGFLELSLEIRDADYSHLERVLTGLINNCKTERPNNGHGHPAPPGSKRKQAV